MIDLKATIATLKVQNVTLRYTRHIDADAANLPKWRFLKAMYAQAGEDTTEKVLISLWNAIMNQERLIFVITRENTRKLVANDKNWSTTIGFKNVNWNFILSVGFKSGLFRVVKAGQGRRPSIYELMDPESRSFFSDQDREAQLRQAEEFVNSLDTQDPEEELPEAVESTEPDREPQREPIGGNRNGNRIQAQSGNRIPAQNGNRNGNHNGDVEGRRKKVEGSAPTPADDLSEETVESMVRSEIREAIVRNKTTYARPLKDAIESLVLTYGDRVSMMDIRRAIDTALSEKSRRKAYEIASEAYEPAIDSWRVRDIPLPTQAQKPHRMSAEEKDEIIAAEFGKRFRDITAELLAQVEGENA